MLPADIANYATLPSMSVVPIRDGEPIGNNTQRRRKYVFTGQIDERIREVYLGHPNAKTRPGIRQLAELVGIPHWALKKRARELGLARTKEKSWSEPELAILARYAWMSDERIRLKLKSAGYARTVTGVHLKLKRMRFKWDPNFYSGKGLAQALGIDSHVVTRWIKSGHLKAQLRGTARGEQQGGDIYLRFAGNATFRPLDWFPRNLVLENSLFADNSPSDHQPQLWCANDQHPKSCTDPDALASNSGWEEVLCKLRSFPL